MKSFLSIVLLTLQPLSFYSPVFADSAETTKKFIVTAYYSPLPDQSFYLKGSYEADLRLNGNGTHGASGKAVYPGMLAAPKSYGFGTKIYLHGLGVWTVDDRGGAIVGSGSRGYDADRLDMWMGQGEEGLKRALTWGKRTVTGTVLSKEESDNYNPLKLEKFKIGKIDKTQYMKPADEVGEDLSEPVPEDIFSVSITRNSSPEAIARLQTILQNLWYFEWAIDGKYSKKLEDAIYNFQLANKLVASRTNLGAGFYGVKTRAKLQEAFARYQVDERLKKEEEARLALQKAEEEERLANVRKKTYAMVMSFGSPREQEVGVHVRKLQQALKKLGYFTWKDTAIFGKNTKEALARYQKDRGVIESLDQKGGGTMNEKTRLALIEDLLNTTDKKDKTLAWNDK